MNQEQQPVQHIVHEAFPLHQIKNDLVISGYATWFGGPNDHEDNSKTASGLNLLKYPKMFGCAIPMHGCNCPLTEKSPIPRIPWNTPINVTCGQYTITCFLIDLGPATKTGNVLDLTPAAFKTLARANGYNPAVGRIPVTYRIVDGAHFLPH